METVEIYRETLRHFLAPIQPLLDDPAVSEVMVVGYDTVYFETAGRIQQAESGFEDEPSLMAAVQNIAEFVGRRLDADNHSMDARLPDGSRVHVIIPPSSRRGVCLTIRKFQPATFTLPSLVDRGSMSDTAAEFLATSVLLHKNIIISGGTGTGKTSMLNALSAAVPNEERIVVIEDTSELQLNQPHTVYLEAQPPRPSGRGGVTIRDLFVDSLRMRPDRIIVGEVRRGEALELIQSMLSGHSGSLTTVHANTPRDAASRLETLCLMNDTGLPVHVARAQVASAIHLVVQISRMADGSRRVQTISEAIGLDDSDKYQWRDLFQFQAQGRDKDDRIQGELLPTGLRPTFADEPAAMGFEDRIQLTEGLFSKSPDFARSSSSNGSHKTEKNTKS
ncbi:putative conjugal transfer protein [Symmachiella macrocystis]|uniref:Putative conjugal transfer protein n=1 Tax=Symmachiella macrocystis TaxID=2527985 RepID=A0A5C6B1N0_9PLAN|nr:ATPase, T2SS/T4P/T4SS family [Symmachiella macrocystis]TWU05322.1 putative conjugal transfer protein [Symmachiella macrocystis]